MAGSLEGRVAIVPGGGGGRGEGICRALAAAGAAVAAVDVACEDAERVAEGLSSEGACCAAIECDVSDRRSVEAMTARVVAELGGVDILVKNAALYPLRA